MDRALTAYYAEEMIRLQDEASLASPIGECLADFSIEDAYRVAGEVLRRREASGWRRLGRKIGFTNRTIWDQYGVYQPIFGYMYESTVSRFEGRHAEIDLSSLMQPLIEPEIYFRLSASPPETDDPVELLGAVEWVGHGFEIVQCHFPDWRFQVADTIADGGLHGRYVVGDGVEVTPAMREELARSLSSFTITLLKDGEVAAQGGGDLVLGSPLNALAHLVRLLRDLPGHPPLEAGELVTTGTLTTALPVSPGETWETRIEGLAVDGLRLRLG